MNCDKSTHMSTELKTGQNIVQQKSSFIKMPSFKFCSILCMIKLFTLVSIIACSESSSKVSIVKFDLRNVSFVTTVDPRFLSFTLDSRQLAKHWETVDIKARKLITLTKQLSPAFLRVGGTDQDNIRFCGNKFQRGNIGALCNEINTNEAKIFESDVKLLGQFVRNTGTNLIYGLNVLQRRTEGGGWDPENSLQLMKFMDSVDIDVFGWELGNEPRRFQKVFNKTLSARQLGKDFNYLRNMLGLVKRYANSSVLGPDVTHSSYFPKKSKFLSDFLRAVQNDTLSGVTFHDYSFAGTAATVLDFLDSVYMDQVAVRIQSVKKTVQDVRPGLQIYLGETSSAWGGGAKNTSDRFVACFMWLDKLGQCALYGIQVVARQSLAAPPGGNSYGLIDSLHRPTPGYFVSYLYKKLVGTTVLHGFTNNDLNKERNISLRVYLHCAKESKGGITLFGMNLGYTPAEIHVTGSKLPQYIHEYSLTPHLGNIRSRFSLLNGKILQTDKEGFIPKLVPKIVKGSFIIPPNSLGFWVLPNADVSVCK